MRPFTSTTTPIRRLRASAKLQPRQFHTTPCLRDAARPSEAEVGRARAYCANLVKTYDAPSHILQTFIPQSSRDAYIAIRAFNVDVARVADTTSTPTIGMMRMQFWRDTVTKALAGSPPKEPVAILLAKAAEDLHERSDGKARLSKNWFHRIINTREQHLSNPPYPTLSALESYAENTYSTMLYLTLSALPQASLTTDHIASHIGKAMGIAAVLRGIPLIAFPPQQPLGTSNAMTGQSGPTQGAVLLPLDVMADSNLREEDVFRQGAAAPGLRDAVFTVATRANDHLITAREMLSKLRSDGTLGHDFEHQNDEGREYTPQQLGAGQQQKLDEVERAFGVFMPSVATQSWLDRLQKADFDVFDQGLRKVDWKLPMKAYWAYTRRKI
ncbi:Squalene/phytoene synthase-domain-containing protein [Paraphoma chrysanthemicola]|uniref:Squalene/phytoene synthase-domain-containing protein n=1 Tax=Paraphoma chrysanthemicola TaxID=798071 RepID=A0A8K0R1V6_9PLEO|nr:Squalene/phytoene synthase-domain-containing protein [Paraphoma chrysanthemicola]